MNTTMQITTIQPILENDLPELSEPMYGSLAVAVLQQLLVQQGFKDLPVTGNFMQQTTDAAFDFQQAVGIQQDGIVGPQTWTALAYNAPCG